MRGLIHLDEPLLCGAEDYGIVAAPAVRVAVLIGVVAQQGAMVGQKLHDDGIRGEDVFAFVFGQAFGIDAVVVEGRVNFQIVFLAGDEVVRAMAGSSVHDAAALIERHVVGEHAGNLNRQKRMLEFHAFEIAALEAREFLGLLDVAIRLQSRDAIRGEQQLPFFRVRRPRIHNPDGTRARDCGEWSRVWWSR